MNIGSIREMAADHEYMRDAEKNDCTVCNVIYLLRYIDQLRKHRHDCVKCGDCTEWPNDG